MYQAHFTWCWCPWWWWSGDDFNVSKYIVSVKCEPSNYGVFGLCVLLHKGSKQAGLSQCTGPWEQLDTKRAALLRECYISSQEISISTMSYGVSLVAQMVKKKKKMCQQCRRPGFDPWVGKIPWRRAWQLTPVFLPGESHGQRSLVGYSPWGAELDTIKQSTHHVF